MSSIEICFPDGEDPKPAVPRASSSVSRILRGGKAYPQRVVREASLEMFAGDPRSFSLGSVLLPFQALFSHLLFLGTSGSGKTTLINQVKRYLIDLVDEGHGRLFIWDFKGEERRYLEPYDIGVPIHYVNPLLAHGVGIDLAAELTTPFAATQFAIDIISPEAKEGAHGMEWVRAARSVFGQVVQSFQKEAAGRWRFIDVLEACQTQANLKRVLSMTRLGRARLEEMLGNRRQAQGVLFTLQGAAEAMWPLAAAMSHAKNISLRDWSSGSGIVVLQHMDEYEDALHPFEKWVFGRAVRLALTAAEQQKTFTMFFLDEARHGPFGRDLMKLATAGRGKGAGLVMGLTDIAGLKDQLNPQQAEEVLGSFSTNVLMMNANPETAEWVSKRAGVQLLSLEKRSVTETISIDTNAPNATEAEVRRIIERHLPTADRKYREMMAGPKGPASEPEATKTINGWGPPGERPGYPTELYRKHGIIPQDCPAQRKENRSVATQTSYDQVERPVLYPSEVMHMPKARVIPGKGLVTSAFVISAYLGMFPMVTTEMDDEEANLLPDPPERYPNRERPGHELDFDGWGPDDEERLKLPPIPPEKRRRR